MNDILINVSALVGSMGYKNGRINLHPCTLIDAVMARDQYRAAMLIVQSNYCSDCLLAETSPGVLGKFLKDCVTIFNKTE